MKWEEERGNTIIPEGSTAVETAAQKPLALPVGQSLRQRQGDLLTTWPKLLVIAQQATDQLAASRRFWRHNCDTVYLAYACICMED